MINGPKPRRVVLVGSALPSGVVEAHTQASAAAAQWQMSFANALVSQMQSDVVCLSFLPVVPGETEPDKEMQESAGVTIVPIAWKRRPGGAVMYAWKMLRAIMRFRRQVDLVVAYNPGFWTAPWARLLSMLSRTPLLMIIADVASPGSGGARARILAVIERRMIGLSHRFLVLAPSVRELLPQNAKVTDFPGLPDQKILALLLPHYRSTRRFVFSGSLGDYGGINEFLAAAEQVAGRGVDCEFHVFGRGAIDKALSPALTTKLTIHGFVSGDELNAFLGEDCICVNPRPHGESINRYNAPYKLLYYCARGVATITTITPGVPADIASACIVASDGVESLARAMDHVLQISPAELQSLGAKARAIVRENYSERALADRLSEIW